MDDLFLALDGLIARREVMILIHADFLGRQVADMSHAGLHHVFAAQKFLDGLHLGRDSTIIRSLPIPVRPEEIEDAAAPRANVSIRSRESPQ